MKLRKNPQATLLHLVPLAQADEGIAEDRAEYLKQNRAKLREYVLKYVIKK